MTHYKWLHRDDVQTVLRVLPDTRCVGGCVRDALLAQDTINTEVDMATPLTPPEVQARLTKANIKNLDIGIAHGTITALIGNHKIEITTLRRDVATDGRHATIAFSDSWHEDAARRDFTINALYVDVEGTLHDPTGQGCADIEARHVRFIGDAATRLREDYLRLLRYVRFHFMLAADTPPDNAALTAMREAVPHLQELSGERKRDELFKILALPQAAKAVQVLQGIGACLYVLGRDTADIARLTTLITTHGTNADALLRLASLLPDAYPDAAAVAQTADILRLSNKQKTRLIEACRAMVADGRTAHIARLIYRHGAGAAQPRVHLYIARLLYWYGAERMCDQARLYIADKDLCAKILNISASWQSPRFPLTGAMLKQAGVAEGARMGKILKELEEWWVQADFPDDMDALKEKMHRFVQLDAF